MNRIDRLLGLILFLQSRRYATAASMAEHFGLSQRTIYRDMRALAEAGVPVLAEAGVGYSLMRGYLLPPVNFTEEEANSLATGAMLIEHAAAFSLSSHAATALQKIRAVLPPARQDEMLRVKRGTGSTADTPPPTAQSDLGLIQKALGRCQTLRLLYQGYGKPVPEERVVEPMGLLFYLGRWHLIAWCQRRQAIRDFRTDRISVMEMCSEHFAPRGDFNPAAYVREQMPSPQLRAKIRFHPDAVDRAQREWWMGVQEDRLVVESGETVLTLAVVDWDHLASWLLSFGPMATVLEPAQLRELLVTCAEAAARHHRTQND